jgi:L-amino acid N-acyltransferase YncA
MEIRRLEPGDRDALKGFFERIPEGDRTFFKEDVLDPEAVEAWLRDRRGRRLVAVEDGRIMGYTAVLPGVGWSSHVGELRVVVDPGYRRRGLGRRLAQQGLLQAVELGLGKIVVEVVADQSATVAMFQQLGFSGEALLRSQVQDRSGQLRDLIVLGHIIDETWSALSTAGIDDAIGSGATEP